MRRAYCYLFGLSVAVVLSSAQAGPASSTELSRAMQQLKAHIDKTATLDAQGLNRQAAIIQKNIELIGQTASIIGEALDVVSRYETKVGPLFVNKATRIGFPRTPAGGLELGRAMFAFLQGLLDHAFSPGNLQKFRKVLDGAAFKTASYFPGAVDAPADPTSVHVRLINASHPACWGIPVMDTEKPARRPTACYLAPGSIATVTVSRSMVGKGFSIRVGAHSWDLWKKPKVLRLGRVSIVYPIEDIHTSIANELHWRSV